MITKYYLATSLISICAISSPSLADSCKPCDQLEGIWKLDEAETFKLRVNKGVPWHIENRYGVYIVGKIIREFNKDKYHLYNENTGEIEDSGKIKFIKHNDNEVVIRIFPESNTLKINDKKFDELLEYGTFPGDYIPCIVGIKLINDSKAESFSYVKGLGKGEVESKMDNAIWVKIDNVPSVTSDNN